MLDEEHEPLPQPCGDHNVYSLGSIGGRNVVITGLHTTDNSSAATVVTLMKRAYSKLGFGLLVGIGAGVPTTTNDRLIRLGDIVVVKPVGENPGVMQYDRGKAEVGHFRRTGSLAPPPAALLNAAQDLAAKRARKHADLIWENIKRIDTDKPGLQKYKHPGPSQDHLYRPEYIHLDSGVSCDQCGCDPTERVQSYTNYDPENGDPRVVVHRGTIASGGKVIKDGVLRDQLAEQYGALCFETEAASVLADFPCIIVYGISSYADFHNYNRWKGYAAAAAAAYARQLFFHLPIEDMKQYVLP